MLIVILAVTCVLFWVGMVCAYFRREIGDWLDNRFGPDSKPEKPRGRRFWQIYD